MEHIKITIDEIVENPQPEASVEDAEKKQLDTMFSLDKKKKNKKQKDKEKKEKEKKEKELYTYKFMLNRFYLNIKDDQSEKSLRLPMIKIALLKKKTIWINFNNICCALSRTKESVINYFKANLHCEIIIDFENKLIIKKTVQLQVLHNILKAYVNKFVKCISCSSMNTNYIKDRVKKMNGVECMDCKTIKYL